MRSVMGCLIGTLSRTAMALPGRWRCRVRRLGRAKARTQDTPEALGNVLALQRLAQNFPDPDRARALEQLSAAVAAHQHDADVRPQPSDLPGELGADELRHRFVGQNGVEALRRLA